MIEIKMLKQLIRLMKDNDLMEMDLRDSEQQVTLKRGPGGEPVPLHPPPQAPARVGAAATPEPSAAETEQPPAAEAGLVEINSPMVGTFYAAPSPDAEPFVHVGSRVDPETVVCVIEAMKVFNEIKAEATGTIQKALVGSGQAVEYGQALFLVKPD